MVLEAVSRKETRLWAWAGWLVSVKAIVAWRVLRLDDMSCVD